MRLPSQGERLRLIFSQLQGGAAARARHRQRLSLVRSQRPVPEDHVQPGSGDPARVCCRADPARSAVVEACAGSGKGPGCWPAHRAPAAHVAPAEILAITFTRKAAAKSRNVSSTGCASSRWHRTTRSGGFLSSATSPIANLTRRPFALRPRALRARHHGAAGLAVNTFHGWFLQLVAVAPLSASSPAPRWPTTGRAA